MGFNHLQTLPVEYFHKNHIDGKKYTFIFYEVITLLSCFLIKDSIMGWFGGALFGEIQEQRFEKIILTEKKISELQNKLSEQEAASDIEITRIEIDDQKKYFDMLSSAWNTENTRLNRTFTVIAAYVGLATFSIPVFKFCFGVIPLKWEFYIIPVALIYVFGPIVWALVRARVKYSRRRHTIPSTPTPSPSSM
ncbi:hypothetical protein HK16_19720 [Acetobacter senegalensis]|uniref:Uncharacterized protein n=2 Tax=Acetobacter TaxID=434 RepID=A0A252EFM1_9PROT|nr:hypothetical protein CIW82_13480 [Acetobacter tropicalis]OUL64994.1 hypothetical protein HK16_19720 [Acetobacter senegalensis]